MPALADIRSMSTRKVPFGIDDPIVRKAREVVGRGDATRIAHTLEVDVIGRRDHVDDHIASEHKGAVGLIDITHVDHAEQRVAIDVDRIG